MKSNPFASKITLALVAVLLASSASAYELLSPRRTWDSAPRVIVDDRGMPSVTDGDGGRTRVRNAIRSDDAWNGSGAGIVVRSTIRSVANFGLGDGVPMLNFTDPIGVCTGSCLAATFIGYFDRRSDGTYRIFDADIVTNPAYKWASRGETCDRNRGLSSEFYIEAVIVHEVGHVLGLGHSGVSNATMFPSTGPCNDSPRTTASDDESAIRDLY